MLAATIILAACLLSIARLLLPFSNQYQSQIEAWATKQLHVPVKIAEIDALWQGLQPTFKFKQVLIGGSEKNAPEIRVDELYVGIDLIQSLLHRQFILGGLKLAGADLRIYTNEQGHFAIQDISASKKKSHLNFFAPEQEFAWLLQQPRLSLSDVNIVLVPSSGKSTRIEQLRLSLTNSARKHLLNGSATINGTPKSQVQLVAKLYGRVDELEKMRGKFYINMQAINFKDWLQYFPALEGKIKSGQGDLALWGHMRQGELHKMQAKFLFQDANIDNRQTQHTVNAMSGFLRWKTLKSGGWLLSSKNLTITLDDKLLPSNQLRIQVSAEDYATRRTINFYLGHLQLDVVFPLIKASDHIPESWKKRLSQGSVSGNLKEVNLALQIYENKIANFSFGSDVSNLNIHGFDEIPAISGFSGMLKTSNYSGSLELNSRNARVNLKKLFRAPLDFSTLTGNINWWFEAGQWHVSAPELMAANDFASAKANLVLHIPKDGQDVDLELLATAHSNQFDNHQIKRHLPVGILASSVVEWLDNSLLSGKSSDVELILRGPMKNFPFDDKSGTFIINGDVNDLVLAYYPDWPVAESLTGKVHFTGREMSAEVVSGAISGMTIQKLAAKIPYMGKHHPVKLLLSGQASGDLAQGQDFILQSPLKTLFGDAFAEMQLTGPSKIDLKLGIPLSHQAVPKVNGRVTTKQGTFHYPVVGLLAEDLNGTVEFTEKDLKSHDITAKLFTQPVSVDIQKKNPGLVFTFDGKADVVSLLRNYGVNLGDFLTGIFPFNATLTLQEGLGSQLDINSDFVGLRSTFPDSFTKQAKQSKPGNVRARFNDKILHIDFDYDKFAQGLLDFVHESDGLHFDSGHITLHGDSPHQQTLSGLLVDGQVGDFNADTWIDTVSKLQKLGEASQSSVQVTDLIRQINLETKKLSFMDYFYDNVSLSLQPELQDWKVSVSSEDLQGKIILPRDQQKPLKLVWDKLHLLDKQPDANSEPVDIAKIPAFDFSAKDLQMLSRQLGHVSFNAKHIEHGLAFDKISVGDKNYLLNAKGRWTQKNGKLESIFYGRMQSTDIATLLGAWDLPDNIHSKDTVIDFTLHWPDAPSNFNLAKLSGDFALHMGEGYIEGLSRDADAKLGLGRIITLLSLRSLPKRLQMNFSDLTHKGFYFDGVDGNFVLRDGNATTEDVHLNGTVAEVDLIGRVGLNQQDYDLELSILPHLTSSLPLVATIAGGPIAGAATWVVEKIVSREVNKITKNVYIIQGDWADPQIQQVE